MSGERTRLVPKLRFPEFRAEGWSIENIGDLLDESRIPSPLNDPSKRITVRLHLQGVEHREHRGTESTESTNNFWRKAGQFIYGKQNIHKGAFGIVPLHLDGFETSQDLPCFDFKDRCCPQWFYFSLAREAVYSEVELKMTGTGSKRLNEKAFLNLPISVPPRPEQQKIADCLSSLDELIAAQGRKVEALKIHKKGLMQQLFPREGENQPRLQFTEFQNNEEWRKEPLGGLCVRIMDGTHFSPKSKEGPRPYLTSKNIKDGRIDLSNLSHISEEEHAEIYSKCPAKPHDVLLTKDGANTGNCALNNLDFEFSLLSSVAVLRGDPKKLRQEFLFQSIMSDSIQSLITESMSGQAITRITLAKIGGFTFPVTSLAEQQRIADCLTSLDTLTTAAAQALDTLKTHKQGLMQQLFPSAEAVAA